MSLDKEITKLLVKWRRHKEACAALEDQIKQLRSARAKALKQLAELEGEDHARRTH